MSVVIVIMAGGAGTRFWPLSTEKKPKQFLKLFGERSLLQQSYDRVADMVTPDRLLVLTNEAFVPLVKEQLPQVPGENIIGEPMRRDTAAAVALAALICKKRFGNPVMAIMTADHIIEPVDVFQKAIISASKVAHTQEFLYTFGIKPANPATGYGYLEVIKEVKDDGGIKHFKLAAFKEKPDAATARKYVESNRYYWNSGMFVWQTNAILNEFKKHLPSHLEHIEKALEKDQTPEWEEALKSAFEPLEKISIDFAIMEKATTVRTVVSDFSWSDVGGWSALNELMDSDEEGNTNRGNLVSYDAKSNMVFCEDESETVAVVGIDNLIVVRAGNKTLVVDKSRAEDIKKLVEGLDDNLK